MDYIEMPYLVERAGRIIEISDQFLKFSGFSKDELLNRNSCEVWRDNFRINVQPDTMGDKTDIILFTKALHVRFVTAVKREPDPDGKIIYIFVEKMNSQLEGKLQFINKIIDDNKIGVGIYTVSDFMLIKANPLYLSYLEKPYNTKEIAYGKCLRELVTDFTGSSGEEALNNVVKTNKSIYYIEKKRLIFGDDKRRWNNIIIPVTENNKVEYIVSMVNDMTREFLLKKNIKMKNKELEAILENIKGGLTVIDKYGRIIRASKAIRSIAEENNIDGKMTIGDIGRIFISDSNQYDEDGRKLTLKDIPFNRLLDGQKVNQQRIIIKNDIVEKYIDFDGTPVLDENGDFLYGVILSHDVTDIIQKENKIKHQQELLIKSEKEQREVLEKALEMKDDFIGLISHEFRTPLNVIYSALQLIEHKYSNEIPDRVKELLGSIKQNTFRQMRLVNNLLDATKLNSGRVEIYECSTDIIMFTKALVGSVIAYALQKNIDIRFRSNIKSKIINVDKEKYERIILNLLSNALKFTDEGGSITVTVNEIKGTDKIRIRVKDTGIGIPGDMQEHIFERFGQVDGKLLKHAEGAGIGLFIVKSLVNMLRGTVKLKSKLGSGSTFIVEIPVKEPAEDNRTENHMDSRIINKIDIEFSDIYL